MFLRKGENIGNVVRVFSRGILLGGIFKGIYQMLLGYFQGGILLGGIYRFVRVFLRKGENIGNVLYLI